MIVKVGRALPPGPCFRETFLILFLCAASCLAADPVLISLKENDTAVLILDRERADHSRPEVVIAPSQSPGRVIVERRIDPDPKDWTEVRWVIRFDLAKAATSFRQAKLHLWCQGTAGSPKVAPKLELIQTTDLQRIVSQDRASQPLLPNAVEIPFPSTAQMIEIDVTAQIQETVKRKLPFAAFRISAVCDKPECAGKEPQNFYFGGSTNVWSWPQSEAPMLEITP
jgi:hypothetical protein